MSKKEEFKEFVRLHPELIKFVENDTMTWQKFYEIYDLYGQSSSVWDKYLNTSNESRSSNNNHYTNFSDIINMAKNIDVDKVQDGITSLQKALGLVSDLFIKNGDSKPNSNYTPRPLYRSFED